MKKRGNGGPAGVLLPSPSTTSESSSSSSLRVYRDDQRVAFKLYPGNGHATENGSHTGRGELAASVPDIGLPRKPSWVTDSSSQAGSADPHHALTQSSTLTLVDARGAEESSVGTTCLKEFVLIDDDDDGDMSLREKTVTDVWLTGGAAAELVCRRLFSSSSASVSDAREESPPPDAPRPEETPTSPEQTRCCLCSIL